MQIEFNLQFFGGRGAASPVVDTSYQGNGGYAKASSTGITADAMTNKIENLAPNVKANSEYDLKVLESIKGNPNAPITIYRATVGNTINNGDWVFINPAKAERWTKTPMGRPKPGVKVVTMTVKAKQVAWTGKNLEFMYDKGKR